MDYFLLGKTEHQCENVSCDRPGPGLGAMSRGALRSPGLAAAATALVSSRSPANTDRVLPINGQGYRHRAVSGPAAEVALR